MDINNELLQDLWQVSGVNKDIWTTLIDTYNNATADEEKNHALAHIMWHLGHKMDDGKFNEVKEKISKTGPNNNGFEYVDLGLPSHTLWATCNVGAATPLDCGMYFQWGDSQGYSADQIGTNEGQKKFSDGDYKFINKGPGDIFTKYTTKDAKLDLDDDGAHIYMGGDWHMPSTAQIQELIDNTTIQSTMPVIGKVFGTTFTSKNDPSKSIFFVHAGYASNGQIQWNNGTGYYWSPEITPSENSFAQALIVDGSAKINTNGRFLGCSIRGVIG